MREIKLWYEEGGYYLDPKLYVIGCDGSVLRKSDLYEVDAVVEYIYKKEDKI